MIAHLISPYIILLNHFGISDIASMIKGTGSSIYDKGKSLLAQDMANNQAA